MFKRYLRLNLAPFCYPAESVTAEPVIDTFDALMKDDEPVKDDVIPLGDKTKKEEAKPDEEEKDDKEEEEEVDELKEIEEELVEPDDEKLELVVPVSRREILKTYPELFKKFPYLEKAYYREQQYTEILPTLDSAREAVEAKQVLDKFDADLKDGNLERVLMAAKESETGFLKVVDNYLTTLAKVDEKAYHHVIGNTTKHIIASMVREGRKTNNEALENAAVLLNQFVFGSTDYTPPSNLYREDKKDTTQLDAIKAKEQELNKREFDKNKNELSTKVNNSIKSTIDAHIDPKGTMSDYVKKNATREAFETLDGLIKNDKRFGTLVDRLWDNATKKNFDKQSIDLLRSAFLTQAKTLLPSVIKKARNEALKGMGKRVEKESDDKTPVKAKDESQSHKKSDKPIENKTTLEYFMED